MNRSPGPTRWSAGRQNPTTSTSVSVSLTSALSRSPSSVRGRCSPGVSTRISCASGRCTMPRIVCRVVCGRPDVIATFWPTSALVSVDLPALGRPTKQAKPDRKVIGSLRGCRTSASSVRRRRSRSRARRRTRAATWLTRTVANLRRRPSTRSATRCSPWMSPADPRSGTLPKALASRPPAVSTSSSSTSSPNSSPSSSRPSRAGTRNTPSPRSSTTGAVGSCSSVSSPTISSSASSMVTSPAMPPYSSTTIAMCDVPVLQLAQQLVDGLGLGHEHRGPGQRAGGGVEHGLLLVVVRAPGGRDRQPPDHVLEVENTGQVVDRLARQRDAGEARPQQQGERLAHGRVVGRGDHVGAGNHHLARERVARARAPSGTSPAPRPR